MFADVPLDAIVTLFEHYGTPMQLVPSPHSQELPIDLLTRVTGFGHNPHVVWVVLFAPSCDSVEQRL